MDYSPLIVGYLVVAAVFGFLGLWIAAQKNRSEGEGFLLGALFGPFGALIEACLPSLARAAPVAPAVDPGAASRQQSAREADREYWAEQRRIQAEYLKARDERRAERRVLREERQAERDKAYRARGVEPGPFAWFHALPDLTQALILGATLAVPAVIALCVFLVPRVDAVEDQSSRPAEQAGAGSEATNVPPPAAPPPTLQPPVAVAKLLSDYGGARVEQLFLIAAENERDGAHGVGSLWYKDVVNQYPTSPIVEWARAGMVRCEAIAYGSVP
jgi:hypothetical protein